MEESSGGLARGGGVVDESILEQHQQRIIITCTSLSGLIAGIILGFVGTPTGLLAYVTVLSAVTVQHPVIYLIGYDVTKFDDKKNLYVVVTVFAMWFITSTIIFTTRANATL